MHRNGGIVFLQFSFMVFFHEFWKGNNARSSALYAIKFLKHSILVDGEGIT